VFERGEPGGKDLEVGEVVGGEQLALNDGEVDFDWLSQEACTGRWIMVAFGNASLSRAAAVQPRCEEPLSTTQNTRRAEAEGSRVMTVVTNAVNGAMPVVSAQCPITCARCTS
jgi:hypothetical protein